MKKQEEEEEEEEEEENKIKMDKRSQKKQTKWNKKKKTKKNKDLTQPLFLVFWDLSFLFLLFCVVVSGSMSVIFEVVIASFVLGPFALQIIVASLLLMLIFLYIYIFFIHIVLVMLSSLLLLYYCLSLFFCHQFFLLFTFSSRFSYFSSSSSHYSSSPPYASSSSVQTKPGSIKGFLNGSYGRDSFWGPLSDQGLRPFVANTTTTNQDGGTKQYFKNWLSLVYQFRGVHQLTLGKRNKTNMQTWIKNGVSYLTLTDVLSPPAAGSLFPPPPS